MNIISECISVPNWYRGNFFIIGQRYSVYNKISYVEIVANTGIKMIIDNIFYLDFFKELPIEQIRKERIDDILG